MTPWYENPLPSDNPRMLLHKAMVHIAEWCDTHGWNNSTMDKIKTWKPELYEKWGKLQDEIDIAFLTTFKEPDTVFQDKGKWAKFHERYIMPYANSCVEILRASKKIV